MTTSTYQSKALADFIDEKKPSREQTKILVKLENFVLHGIASFGGTSIFIQWSWIYGTINRYPNLYIAMVRELKWEAEAQKVIEIWAPGFPVRL